MKKTYIIDMTTSMSRRLNTIMYKGKYYLQCSLKQCCSPSYMWWLAFYSHKYLENTCM